MGVLEVFPTAIYNEKGSRTLVGAATVVDALNNTSTSSYVRAAGTSSQTWFCMLEMDDPRSLIPHGAAISQLQIKMIHSHWRRNPSAWGSETIKPYSIIIARPSGSQLRYLTLTPGEPFSGFSESTSAVTREQPPRTRSWDGKFDLGAALQSTGGRQYYLATAVGRGTSPYYGPNVARLYSVSLLVHYDERPTVTLTEPAGTVVTSRPTFEWEYSDPEGAPAQQVYDVRIYRRSVADSPGFTVLGQAQGKYPYVYRRVIHSPNPFHEVNDDPRRRYPYPDEILPVDFGKSGFGRSGEEFSAFLQAKHWDVWRPPSKLYIPGGPTDPVGNEGEYFSPYSLWSRIDFTLSFASPKTPEITAEYDESLHAILVNAAGGDNELSLDDSSFEDSIGDWSTGGNPETTIAQKSTESFHGADSLMLTRTSTTGSVFAVSPTVSVVGGRLYSATARFKAQTTGRVCKLRIWWRDDSGSLLGSSTTDQHNLTDDTTSWRMCSVVGTAPAEAANAYVGVEIENVNAGEEHYLDAVGLFPERRTTLLTANQASIETDATGWIAGTNTTIDQSVDESKLDSASLRLTRTGSTGNAEAHTATGTSGFEVLPAQDYTVSAWFKPDTVVRNVSLGVEFYNAAGASIAAATFGSTVSEVLDEWTEVTRTVTSPAGAAFMRVILRVANVAVGEFHYADAIGVWPGTDTGVVEPWEAGGLVHDDPEDYSIELHRSIDGGTTWELVQYEELVADEANQTIFFADYEVPSAATAQYRAQITSTNIDGDTVSSAVSKPVSAVMPTFNSWYLRDIGSSPVLSLAVHMATANLTTPKPNTLGYAAGGDSAVMTHSGVKKDDLACSLFLLNQGDYDTFRAMVDSGRTLLLQDTFGRQWYVQPDDGTEYEVLRSTKLNDELWPTRHAHAVDIQFRSVERLQRQIIDA